MRWLGRKLARATDAFNPGAQPSRERHDGVVAGPSRSGGGDFRRFHAERSDYKALVGVVERAMRRVLDDIDATTPYRPTMRLEDGDDWPSTIECWGFLDTRSGRAVTVQPSEGEERVTTLLTDEMSEEVSEALARDHRLDEAATWPTCPGHPHSLDPVVSADLAVWRCRDDPRIETAVGTLRAAWK